MNRGLTATVAALDRKPDKHDAQGPILDRDWMILFLSC